MSDNPNAGPENWILERREKSHQYLVQLVESNLELDRWGFKKSYSLISVNDLPTVIYNSEWCRLRFVFNKGIQRSSDELAVCYGRLHAPNSSVEDIAILNGENCYCWHRVESVINFLDGVSPQEAVDQMRVHHQWPRLIEQFRQLEEWKEKTQPEQQVIINAAIWENYGQSFFNLFDLRRPDLWEKYTQFIKEFFKIKVLNPDITPPRDQIC
jgi:hypothetical protein